MKLNEELMVLNEMGTAHWSVWGHHHSSCYFANFLEWEGTLRHMSCRVGIFHSVESFYREVVADIVVGRIELFEVHK